MKSIKKIRIFMIAFFLIILLPACGEKPQKPAPKPEDTLPEMPKVIEEIEKDILKIMTLADKIPYFERVIIQKEKIEEKSKIEKIQMAEIGEELGQESESKPKTSSPQEQPKPMTIEDSILTEILNKEKTSPEDKKEDKPPKDIAETWKSINTTTRGLHDKWNVLEPLLIKQTVSPEILTEFEDNMDKLTNLAISKNYFGAITTANKLTSFLPKFMAFYKKDIPPTIFVLKYHLRDVVLNAAVENYPQAQESLNQIKEQSQNIKTDLIEKKAKSTAEKFDASLANLQKSLEKKDINLIKINAAITMKNIILMKDDLLGSI